MKKLLSCVLDQATPAVTPNDYAILTTIASDIGADAHPDSGFYQSGRRSAEIVNACFDTIINWEKPFESPHEPSPTKTLATSGYLPFADVFAWFAKSNDDFPAAGQHLLSLLKATKPLIVLTYGQLPSYLALESFTDLTSKWYYDTQRRENSEGGGDYFIRILGLPEIRSLGRVGEEVVVIPCYHPGYLAQAGLPSVKATKLFFLIHQIVWYSMGTVLQTLQTKSKSKAPTRKHLCDEVVARINDILKPDHVFGKAFSAAKQEAIDVTAAFAQGKLSRNLAKTQSISRKTKKAGYVRKMPEGWVRKQAYKSGKLGPVVATGPAIGGYDVKLKKTNLTLSQATKNDRERFLVIWTEPATDDEDEKLWQIGPLVLPNGIINAPEDKKLLYYTDEGLDIRDSKGVSLGERRITISGKVKTCSLPISTIILFANIDDEEDHKFFKHWEETMGLEIDQVLLDAVSAGVSNTDQFEGYIPKDWFAASSFKRALPVASAFSLLQTKAKDNYAGLINVPAYPGDFLWLFSELFHDYYDKYEKGSKKSSDDFNLTAASDHPQSVFRMMAQLCHKRKYRNHPYWRTFLALAHMSNIGVAENAMASNVVVMALTKLAKYEKQKKNFTLQVAGQKKSISSWHFTIKKPEDFISGAVADLKKEPELKYDAKITEERDPELELEDEEMEDQGDEEMEGQGVEDEDDEMLLNF